MRLFLNRKFPPEHIQLKSSDLNPEQIVCPVSIFAPFNLLIKFWLPPHFYLFSIRSFFLIWQAICVCVFVYV